LILAIAVIIGIVQNSRRVEISYLVWTGQPSLAVVLMVTVVATVTLTTVVGVVWRRSRRGHLTHRDELEHLREVEPDRGPRRLPTSRL